MAKTAEAKIKISADTQGLESAIKRATNLIKGLTDSPKKALKTTQNNISAVDKALKSNSTSTDLIRQKQGYLKTAVSQASDQLREQKAALSALQNAPDSDKTIEQQRTLSREITKTESELKNLKREMYGTSSLWAEKLKGASQSLKSVSARMAQVGSDLTLEKLKSSVKEGISLAEKFGTSTTKVKSILLANGDAAASKMAGIKKQVIALSNESGVAASKLMEDTYNAISAGAKGKNAVAQVAAAEKLATAGFTSSSQALDVLTTITNAYGKAAGNANHQASVLLTTQNLGKVTVNQLSHTMGNIIPIAKMNNVSLEDMSAGYVALTKNGVNAMITTTYLRRLYGEFGKSTSAASKALQASTGQDLSAFLASGHNIGQALQVLQEYCDKTGTKFQDLWSNINAKAAAGALTDYAKDYQDAYQKMNSKSNDSVANKAYEQMMNTPEKRMERIKTSLQNMKLTLGESLLPTLEPMIKSAADAIGKLSTAFSEMNPGMQGFIAKSIAGFAFLGPGIANLSKGIDVLSGVSRVFGTLGGGIAGTVAKIKDFSSALKLAKNPFGFLATGGGKVNALSKAFKSVSTGAGLTGLKIAAIAAAAVAATVAVVKLVKWLTKVSANNKKKSNAKKSVQSAADQYQQAKINYENGKGSAEAVKAAKQSYDQAQAAYKKQYGKPAKVKFKTSTQFDKETFKKHTDAAKKAAKQAKENAKASGLSGKEQKAAYDKAYASQLKLLEGQKKTKQGYEELQKATKKAAESQAKVTKSKAKNGAKSGIQKATKSKVAFQADTSDVSAKVKQAAKTGKSAKAKIKVTADISSANSGIKKIDKAMRKLSNKKIKMKVNLSGAGKSAATLRKTYSSSINAINRQKITIRKPNIKPVTSAARQMKSSVMKVIRSISHLRWSIAKPRVPKFSMSGSFNPETGAVPKISVHYKRAMQLGAILDQATLFPLNNGTFAQAGEAGPEAIIGTHSLSDLVYSASQQSTLDMIRNSNDQYQQYYSGLINAQENDYGYRYAQSILNGETPNDLGYVDYSAEILPPASSTNQTTNSTSVGKIEFSPNVFIGSPDRNNPTNNGNTDAERLMRKLKELGPEFVDYIMQELSQRQEASYA